MEEKVDLMIVSLISIVVRVSMLLPSSNNYNLLKWGKRWGEEDSSEIHHTCCTPLAKVFTASKYAQLERA